MIPGHRQITPPKDFIEVHKDSIEQSIASRFEQNARLHKDRIALKQADRVLTYDQLNRAANRISQTILVRHPFKSLPSQGSGDLSYWEYHAEPIAVFMEQGIDAIVAALGLLKAGKLFVPIDPADPHTRNGYILRHAPVRLILTNQGNQGDVTELALPDCEVINIDRIGPGVPDKNPELPISPIDPALLIYTSGSTGQPKGLIHSQRNVLHDSMVKTNLMRISPSDRLSLLAWGTGQAVKTIFTALLNGSSLHPFNLKRLGVNHLANWMRQERITLNTISAPICRSFLELLNSDIKFPQLRILRLASDTVYPEDIARMKEHFEPHCYFVNALASNETGIICANVMNQSTPVETARVPVGYPLEDITVRLLDEKGGQVPDGEPGTIEISSRYIARGYWRRSDLTEKAFCMDPDDPEVVAFRSNDLARFQPDGTLELLGRNDFLVKIRGYRVETAEVEAALLGHENVKDAVVHPYESDQHEKRLIGYIVPRNRPAPTTSGLHQFLKVRVTEYMIPAAFVVMEKIPLLSTGKTNRRALPAPGRTRPVLDKAYVAPSSIVEKRLVEIWSQVVGIDGVGIHDPFMELGGDSLRVGQVMARIIDAFGVDLPLRQMFELSTIAQIAKAIEQRQTENSGNGKRPIIERHPGKGPWELSFGQKRLWFLNQLDPLSTAYNMPKPVRLIGKLNIAALTEAVEWILIRHEALRTHYKSLQGVPFAEVTDIHSIEIPYIDLGDLPETQRENELQSLMTEQSLKPFDLEHDLKLKCTLFRLGEEDHVLLCLTHHIASDGWSRGLLMRELTTHYGALVAGEPCSLGELPIQYSDFARWQAARQNTANLKNQMTYWLERLRSLPASLNMPTDRPRAKMQSSRGALYSMTIPPALSQALETMAQRENVTLFMLLQASFNALLHRYTGQDDLVIGCPVAGRSVTETEDLIGFFVNSLVMRTDLSGDPTFRELLDRVRETALGAYANPDVPFEHLVEALKIRRDLSKNPIFQILFDVHRIRGAELQASGITFSLMEMEKQSSTLDQSWNIAIIDDHLRIRVKYNRDLFDSTTIARMCGHYVTLLEDVVADPNTPVSTLPFQTREEQPLKLETGSSGTRSPALSHPAAHVRKTHAEPAIARADPDLEKSMVEIWKELLAVDEVGVNDDFFNLGGQSLFAMRFIDRLRLKLNIQLSMRDLFDSPTIAGLISLIHSRNKAEKTHL